MTALVAAALAVLAAGLALAAHRARARAAELERRVTLAARELERMQTAFSRFAPEAVIEDVLEGAPVDPVKREVTVPFADLKGFTSMSEELDPAVLVGMLNGYFRAMSRAISAHRGHVAKFMGDGIMAIFGAPEHNPWQAKDAVAAALEMRRALASYNGELRARGLPQLEFGVGVHLGSAVAGVIGSEQLVEFTVIGDTVNVASRVESATRGHGVDILISDDVKRRLDDRVALRAVAPTPVKGKPEPLILWAVERD